MKRIMTFVAGVGFLGAGIPVVWMWVASKVENDRAGLSPIALLVMTAGLLISYAVVLMVADAQDQRTNPRRQTRRQDAWNRSLGADRLERRTLSSVERMFVAIVAVVTVAFEVWFIFFAGSSLPVGT